MFYIYIFVMRVTTVRVFFVCLFLVFCFYWYAS